MISKAYLILLALVILGLVAEKAAAGKRSLANEAEEGVRDFVEEEELFNKLYELSELDMQLCDDDEDTALDAKEVKKILTNKLQILKVLPETLAGELKPTMALIKLANLDAKECSEENFALYDQMIADEREEFYPRVHLIAFIEENAKLLRKKCGFTEKESQEA